MKRTAISFCALIGAFCLMAGALSGCQSDGPSSSPGGAEESGTEAGDVQMQIPDFSDFYYDMKDTSYTIELREEGGDWQPITPYSVRVNPNDYQNTQIDQPVQLSPMAYFGIGEKPVEVRIQKKEGSIQTATLHPLSLGIPVTVEDGYATFQLSGPGNVGVRINDERYDMVYIFANPIDPDMPQESTDDVIVCKPGLRNLPKIGTEVWAGGISDARIYDRVLTQEEIQTLAQNGEVSGYTDRWALAEDMRNEMQPSDVPSTYNQPTVQADYNGRPALVTNGFEDAVMTGRLFNVREDYTISVWAYQEPGTEGAQRTIINHMLFVRSDGKVGSNIGDWQFPYVTDTTFTPGAWHHVLLTKNGNEVTVYIDGVSGGTKTRPDKEEQAYLGFGSGTIVNGLQLRDNQTLYLQPGAVVRGSIMAYGVQNVQIMGSGIIDVTPTQTTQSYTGITCAYSDGVAIEGVIVNNPSSFNVTMGQSKNITINNFKCFSSYGASDGLNMKACENVTIDGCFLRTNDDTTSVYATSVGYLGSTKNITIKNSTLINDTGHNMMMGIHGQEFGSDTITDVLYENLDIVDSKSRHSDYQGVMAVNVGNDVVAKHIRYNNIRIEDFNINQLFNLRVCYNPGYNLSPGGGVEDVVFSNITYNGSNAVPSVISGYNTERMVKGITFENVMINGVKMTGDDGQLQVGDYAENITVK